MNLCRTLQRHQIAVYCTFLQAYGNKVDKKETNKTNIYIYINVPILDDA